MIYSVKLKFQVLLFGMMILIFIFPWEVFGEDDVFTVWPLLDYRYSDSLDYSSLNILGPIFNYERKGPEHEFGIRPLFFKAQDPSVKTSYEELLYPVASRKKIPEQTFFQTLHLLTYDFGKRETGSDNEFMFFPFLFYGEDKPLGNYFAFFPFGGKIYDKFGRDEIRFTLFPVYSKTLKRSTTTTNIVWPIFARIRGEKESGIKIWPIWGASNKEGVYRKRFYLWPVFFHYDLRLDTKNPMRKRAAFPFYIDEYSPQYSSRTYLWPFFSHIKDSQKDYEEWNFPWPLFRIARGTYKEGVRFLPFYTNERIGDFNKRWFVWPLYKIEQIQTNIISRRRDRILFFLYSNLEETIRDEGSTRKKQVSLWPLFTYQQIKGVSEFHTLSLLEPFFPDNQGIARNWSPLWHLYLCKWDKHGNEVSSFLWNLYWKERRGSDFAMEVFPFFSYKKETDKGIDFKLFKGLFRYRSGVGGVKVNFFYIPLGIGGKKDNIPMSRGA